MSVGHERQTLAGLLFATGTLALFLLLPGCSHRGPSGAWPMFGHDARHTNRSDADTSTVKGVIKWKYKLQTQQLDLFLELSSPAVGADGTIYVASGTEGHDDPSKGGLYAINPDGTLKWKFDAQASSRLSTPAIANGAIYFSAGFFFGGLSIDVYEDALYALNLDGSIKWKLSGRGGAYSSPIVGADGTLYVVFVRSRFPGMRGGASSPSENFASSLIALTPEGGVKWQAELGIRADTIFSLPAIDRDGIIYVTSLTTIDAFDGGGRLKWSAPADRKGLFFSPTIASHGTIYVGMETHDSAKQANVVYAIKPGGAVGWTIETNGPRPSLLALGADDTLYVGPIAGSLYALRSDGTAKWRFENQGLPLSPLALGGDGIIYAADDNAVYAIRPDGTLKWNSDMRIASLPAIGADGTLYVLSNDGYLLAIH